MKTTKIPLNREEELRLERVVVGQICQCRDCICCAEFTKAYKAGEVRSVKSKR